MVQMSPHILCMLPVAEARSILVLLRFLCVTYFRFCAQHTTSCSTAIRHYVTILYRLRDVTRYLSKVADIHPPHTHLSPGLGLTLLNS